MLLSGVRARLHFSDKRWPDALECCRLIIKIHVLRQSRTRQQLLAAGAGRSCDEDKSLPVRPGDSRLEGREGRWPADIHHRNQQLSGQSDVCSQHRQTPSGVPNRACPPWVSDGRQTDSSDQMPGTQDSSKPTHTSNSLLPHPHEGAHELLDPERTAPRDPHGFERPQPSNMFGDISRSVLGSATSSTPQSRKS